MSAYWHPFKPPDESFAPGTTMEKVWRRYTFSRQLRLFVMDAIERVEVAVLRTFRVEHHARKYWPFGYRVARNFRPEFAGLDHQQMVDKIDQAASLAEQLLTRGRIMTRASVTAVTSPPTRKPLEPRTYDFALDDEVSA